MFAVAAPPKSFAATFKMTGVPKSHPVHQAGITRAFEFVDTCLKDRRVGRLGKVSLSERFEAVADFTGSPATAPDQASAAFRKVRLELMRSVQRPLPPHLSAEAWLQAARQ